MSSNSGDIGLSDLFGSPAGSSEEAGGVTPSEHSSIRSIGSRMRAVGRVLFRADTCLELLTSWMVFLSYTLYWVIIRTASLLYLVSDCPNFGIFNRPACRYPPPLGSNSKFRPLMLIAKVATISCLGYLVFVIANLVQLEVLGHYKLSARCVLSLTKCESNFVIYDETVDISRDELALINSILRPNNLEISGGDLQAVNERKITPINNKTVMSAKSGEKSTSAMLVGEANKVDGNMHEDRNIVYKFETPTVAKENPEIDADPDLGSKTENLVKVAGRHSGLPRIVGRPAVTASRASTGTGLPRLLAATGGKNILEFSSMQVSVPETPKVTTVYWRPWMSVSRRVHHSTTRPTHSTYTSVKPYYFEESTRAKSWPPVKDIVMTTVRPYLHSSIPDLKTQSTKSSSSRFIAFTPMRIVRKRGSRINLERSREMDQEPLDSIQTQMDRPPTGAYN